MPLSLREKGRERAKRCERGMPRADEAEHPSICGPRAWSAASPTNDHREAHQYREQQHIDGQAGCHPYWGATTAASGVAVGRAAGAPTIPTAMDAGKRAQIAADVDTGRNDSH